MNYQRLKSEVFVKIRLSVQDENGKTDIAQRSVVSGLLPQVQIAANGRLGFGPMSVY